MAPSWMWLCVSLLAFGGPPDWGSNGGGWGDTKPTTPAASGWRFACAPGGTTAFGQVSGIADEAMIADYRNGNATTVHARKIPGMRKLSNVTLSAGTDPGWIAAWRAQPSQALSKRECTLSLLSTDGQAVLNVNLHGAVPLILEKSDNGSVARLVLSVDRFDDGT